MSNAQYPEDSDFDDLLRPYEERVGPNAMLNTSITTGRIDANKLTIPASKPLRPYPSQVNPGCGHTVCRGEVVCLSQQAPGKNTTKIGTPMVDMDLDELLEDYEEKQAAADAAAHAAAVANNVPTMLGHLPNVAEMTRRAVEQGLIKPQKKYA